MNPIEEFKSQEELDECLKWWQDKLFLNDWIIKASVEEPEEFILKDVSGENYMNYMLKSCVIRILDKKHYGERICVYCAEKTLVHELLHCKYNWIQPDESYEAKYVDVTEHVLLEQMAKSLIMAKCNLDFDYFRS